MATDFTVSMVLRAVNEMGPAFSEAKAQMAGISNQVDQVQKKIAGFKSMGLIGAGITGLGLAMADGLTKGLEAAGEFQTKLTTIKDVTGATTQQMNQLSDAIMNTSSKVSMFNDMQVGGFAQQLASGGFPNVGDVQKLLLPVSQFAEVQAYEGKSASAEDSVNSAIGMAHLFKNYDAKSLENFLNTFNKYSVMQPGSSEDLTQTLTYLAPTAFRQMHMSQTDVLSMAALANRVGLNGSHGGTNAADMVLRLIPGLIGGAPTKKGTPAAWAAMEKLGLINSNGQSVFFKNGQITNFQSMIQTLINAGKKYNPEQLTQMYKAIFGIQGGRAASIFADPSTLEQLASMNKQLGVTKNMPQMQDDYLKTPEGQMNQLKSNSMTLVLRVFMQLGYILNPLLAKLNNILSAMLKFSEQHPKIAKYVATFASIATAVALIVGPMMMLVAAMGYLKTSTALAEGFKLFGGALTGALGPMLTLVAAGYLLYEAWTHNWGGIQQKTAAVIGWIKAELPPVEEAIKKVAATLGFFNKSGKFQLPSWLPWVAGIFLGTKALTGVFGIASKGFGILNTLGGGVGKLATHFMFLYRDWGLAGAIFKAVFNPMGGVFIKIASSLLRVTGVTKLWAAAQALVNVVMDANPISLIIIGVVALIAGIVLLVTHWKTVVQWLQTAWNWFKNLGVGVQALIAIFMPFIGLPALIIAHWKPIESFFAGLGKTIGNVVGDIGHFLGIGGGSSTPALAAGSGGSSGNAQVTNHFYINSTNPKQAANEVANVQDKYYRSRYPLSPTK